MASPVIIVKPPRPAITVQKKATSVIVIRTPATHIHVMKPQNAPVIVRPLGLKGDKGDKGDAGPQNLFVQETNPGMTAPGVWIETDNAGNIVTFWIENGQ